MRTMIARETSNVEQIKLGQKESKKRKFKEDLTGYLFVGPMLIGTMLFTLMPVVISLFLSFTEWNFLAGLTREALTFVGVENYQKLMKDPIFTKSLMNNFIFILQVPICMAISLVIALIINKQVYFKEFFKVIYFLPFISSVVAISVVWMVLFQPSFGPINQVLMSIGIDNPPRWLGDVKFALPSIMMIVIWAGIGFNLIIYLAGIQGIPTELYEAAEIDGAGAWAKFRQITLPLITPTTFFLLITGVINSFKVFDIINVVTQGGPANSTSLLVYYLYQSAFINLKMGYASTIAWVLFFIIFIITFIQWKFQNKWVHY
ncbi:sugar ABC transporter permease [Bacillus sp. IITD106]|nr:sugar ABC transporter permease [Bacillus sp. IITD106]